MNKLHSAISAALSETVTISSRILAAVAPLLAVAALVIAASGVTSCSKDTTPTGTAMIYNGSKDITLSATQVTGVSIAFSTDYAWTAEVSADAVSWLSLSRTCGDPGGKRNGFTITIIPSENKESTARTGVVSILYGEAKSMNLNVKQTGVSALAESSQFDIPDDMIFSTTLGANTTNVAQGFDYDPDEDVIYIMQKYGAYRNHIGWQKRETKSATTAATNKMTLSCFSHGNNIAIHKASDGKKYVWAPNYGTRQDDGSYDSPQIVSRFLLEAGKTILNTDTKENYFFNIKPCWPAFDFDNDLMVICNYKYFWVYRLSALMALPDEDITLPYEITYGGVVGTINTKRDEYTGFPTVKAKDCSKVKPIATIQFDYSTRGLHWQSYCIDNGWIYAILQADKNTAPDIIFDTYVEAYKIDGTKNLYKVRQEYMQNRDRIVQFKWNTADYFYCEPEGIKVTDGVMLTMYTLRGADDPYLIRRPVIFRLASPVKE